MKKVEPPAKNWRAVTAFLRAAVVLALLAPLGYAIYQQWAEVRQVLAQVNWLQASLGWAILMLAQPLMGAISWIVLRFLKQDFTYWRITAVYFISQAAKYLPGGIWAFPGRVAAYQAIGVEKSASVISLVQEVGALFLGAAALGIAGIYNGLRIELWVRTATLVGALVCLAAVLLSQHPLAWRALSRARRAFEALKLRFKKGRPRPTNPTAAEQSASPTEAFSVAWAPASLLISLIFWLLVGVGFYYLAISVAPQLRQLTWLQAASIFALAWCAGFVVILAPAGLGVREAALSALLVAYIPLSEALSVALMARLWWTLGEALFILIALAWASTNVRWVDPPNPRAKSSLHQGEKQIGGSIDRQTERRI